MPSIFRLTFAALSIPLLAATPTSQPTLDPFCDTLARVLDSGAEFEQIKGAEQGGALLRTWEVKVVLPGAGKSEIQSLFSVGGYRHSYVARFGEQTAANPGRELDDAAIAAV